VYSNLRIAGLVAAGTLLVAGLSSSAFSATSGAGAAPSRAKSTTTTTVSAPTTTTTTTTSAPSIVTSNFLCTGGTCAVGPGNTGLSFAAGLIGTGGPQYTGPECNAYLMKVVSGSLPPGLQLGEPLCEWVISGTPTQSGTYSFAVQISPQPNNLGQTVGTDGIQQLSITIGTGTSDRLFLTGAVWAEFSVDKTLQVGGFDANNGATYTVYVTATGRELGTITESTPDNGGVGTFIARYSESVDLNNLTVKDSLGGSASIPVTVDTHYS
jgi:hypothetical protein